MDTAPTQNTPPPTLTLNLYRRCFKGRKALFASSDSSAASYFLTNPTPHKHSSTWKPVFYRGDNPKYTPDTRAIGRARRSAMWGTFRVWIGDGVQEVLENEKVRQERRKAERKNRLRRWVGRAEKSVDAGEEKVVQGRVVMVKMQRVGLFSRRVEWEVDGERYRWSGTRMFGNRFRFMGKVKGWSHSVKLIRVSDHALIATLEKAMLGSRRSIRTGSPPNKSKTLLGTLNIYDCPGDTIKHPSRSRDETLTSFMAHVDAANTRPSDVKDEEGLNPDGVHSGNLTEDAIVFSCWIVVEAEHRLRCKILDFLEEIGEEIDGG
ncbi:hypothetical protein BDW62DRAFT_2952 [Aspergillus aurantiobrunneus]